MRFLQKVAVKCRGTHFNLLELQALFTRISLYVWSHISSLPNAKLQSARWNPKGGFWNETSHLDLTVTISSGICTACKKYLYIYCYIHTYIILYTYNNCSNYMGLCNIALWHTYYSTSSFTNLRDPPGHPSSTSISPPLIVGTSQQKFGSAKL